MGYSAEERWRCRASSGGSARSCRVAPFRSCRVKPEDVVELHYIAPLDNIESITRLGLLSHNRAARVAHTSVARAEVQARRAPRKVPGGLSLHDYVNLYVDARNPMLYFLKDKHATLTVLRISTDVLYSSGAVIADGNAAADMTGFWPSPSGLERLDASVVFARYWPHADPIESSRRKRMRCAEVLVPHEVGASFLLGAWVSCASAQLAMGRLAPGLDVALFPDLFFV